MCARFGPRFTFVHLDFQLFWDHLFKRLPFLHAIILASLLRINCTCMFGSISGLFMLFSWSIPLSSIQNHSVLIIILVLLENLKSDHLEHPTFFFFSKLFWLFLVIYKFPKQKILLGFWLIVLFYRSIGGGGDSCNNIKSFSVWVWYVSPFVQAIFNLSHQRFVFFSIQKLLYLTLLHNFSKWYFFFCLQVLIASIDFWPLSAILLDLLIVIIVFL